MDIKEALEVIAEVAPVCMRGSNGDSELDAYHAQSLAQAGIVVADRVAELSADRVRVVILADVNPHDGRPLTITAALEDKDRLWRFLKACPHIVKADSYVPDQGGDVKL